MLRNVPIDKMIEKLQAIQQFVTHVDIEIDEKENKILFVPLYSSPGKGTKASALDYKTGLPEGNNKSTEKFDSDKNIDDLIP